MYLAHGIQQVISSYKLPNLGDYMRVCVVCHGEFFNKGRDLCCSIKCKILNGRVVEENGCWIFKKSASGAYGKIRWNGKWYSAHRCSYDVFVEKLDENSNKWVCHTCDTPKCVNPAHLFLGSASDNRKDAVNKKRIPMGENNHFSKFTDKQVLEMRLMKSEGFTYDRLSRIFNCSMAHIFSIIKNKIRKE